MSAWFPLAFSKLILSSFGFHSLNARINMKHFVLKVAWKTTASWQDGIFTGSFEAIAVSLELKLQIG